MKISLLLVLFFSFSLQASPPPCTIWQVKVSTHPVNKYKREDGTKYSKTTREEHCRDRFPTVIQWQDRFLNIMPSGWPHSKEKFREWSQPDKETVLRALSNQPRVLKELSAKLVRGVISSTTKNPGTTVKKLDTIALYDEFFLSRDQSRILSHELSHLYIHDLEKAKLDPLVYELGWRENTKTNLILRIKDIPALKSDSIESVTEDVTNHLEDYLHSPEELKKRFPQRYKLIEELVGNGFKLERR